MRLSENKNPFMTMNHVEALRIYGRTCFGLDVSDSAFCNEVNNIERNTPSRRSPDESTVYEIFDNNEYVGDITITNGEEDYKEISVLVFVNKNNNKVASRALKMAIDILAESGNTKIEAVIRHDNPYRDKVIRIFTNLGFSLAEEFESSGLYRKL